MAPPNSRPLSATTWLRHFFVYGLGIVSLNALSFFIIPIYTRRIPVGEYGVLELLNRGQDILAIVVMGGLGVAALAFFQFEAERKERQHAVFSTALYSVLLHGALLVAVLFPFADGISALLFGTTDYAWAVRIFIFIIPLEVMFQVGLISLQAEFKSTSYVLVTVGRLLFGLGLSVWLVFLLRWGLRGALLSSLLHTGLPALGLFLLAQFRARWALDRKLWMEMLRYGLPFVPAGFFLFILNSGDRYFLNVFHGAATVGLYAVSYKLGSVVMILVLTPFLKIWGSVMVETGKQPQKIARAATYLAAAYCYAGSVLSLLAPALVRWLTGPEYWSAYETVPVIILAYLFWALSTVGDTAFYVTKNTRIKPLLLLAASIVCIALYGILIPGYGAMGAAWATVLAFAFFAAITMRVGQRYLKVPYELGRLLLLLVVSGALYGLGRMSVTRELLSDVVVSVLAMVAFPLLLMVIGFWNADERASATRILASGWNRLLARRLPRVQEDGSST